MDDLLFSAPEPGQVWLCVLASGSGGNCAVLVVECEGKRHAHLIDAGLSARKTRALLEPLGIQLEDVQTVFLTHLDHDHWNPSINEALSERAWFAMHRRHTHAAQRQGLLYRRTHVLEDRPLELPHFQVSASLASHDEHGVCIFRFEFSGPGHSLGYATDLGRVTDRVAEHLAGVGVLAIESNYCPELQRLSPRPALLKNRITGGFGHLSNRQCAEAVARIAPRHHVVLLHLSRDCNRPELAAVAHTGAPYALTVTSQESPTARIRIVKEAGVAATA